MAEKYLDIELATPNSKKGIEHAKSCSAPGVLGKFQILPDHTAFMSELSIGEVKVETPDSTHFFAVSGGFLEVVDNRVLLLLDTAEAAEEIDVERARNARDRAVNRLDSQQENVDRARAEAALARALNRLKVAQRVSTTV